jgi:hypothetical protein
MRKVSPERQGAHTIVVTAFLVAFCILLLLSQFGPQSWQLVINAACCAAWIAVAVSGLIRRDKAYLILNYVLLAVWFLGETLRLAWPRGPFSYEPWSNLLSLAGILALAALAVNMVRHLPGVEEPSHGSRRIHLTPPLPDHGATASR